MLFLTLLFYSCNSIFCGELTGEWASTLNLVKNKYINNFRIENIPCDFYYINITALNKNIDTALLNTVHKELYNPINKVGWLVLKVYDNKGNFLFVHKYDGRISQK
jgi:hypothetical protein